MGVGYKGEPRTITPGVELLPTNLRGGDIVGGYRARIEWEALQPDVIFALNDPWYLEHYSRHLADVLGTVPMIGYLPLDGDFDDPALVRDLKGFRALYTYTEHAAAQLRGALAACGNETPVGVAGHGVDVRAFAPAPEVAAGDFGASPRMALAAGLFGLDEHAWVVLNASRPDPRKRIDLTIDAFAQFARGKPANVRLCLHQAIGHPQFVEPLREQVTALGIEERMLWWPPRAGAIDDRALSAVYNACATGLNTSRGEGFGLVSFEHGATGAPQIVPAHAALRELWGESAVLVEPVTPVRVDHSPLVMGEVSPDGVADALERLWGDRDAYRKHARAAWERAHRDDLRWDAVADVLLRALCSD